jgi:hypothetical protein
MRWVTDGSGRDHKTHTGRALLELKSKLCAFTPGEDNFDYTATLKALGKSTIHYMPNLLLALDLAYIRHMVREFACRASRASQSEHLPRLALLQVVRDHKHNITSTVITLPAMFNLAQRNIMREAAELVGLPNVTFVPEPIAAAMRFVEQNRRTSYFDHGRGMTYYKYNYAIIVFVLTPSN